VHFDGVKAILLCQKSRKNSLLDTIIIAEKTPIQVVQNYYQKISEGKDEKRMAPFSNRVSLNSVERQTSTFNESTSNDTNLKNTPKACHIVETDTASGTSKMSVFDEDRKRIFSHLEKSVPKILSKMETINARTHRKIGEEIDDVSSILLKGEMPTIS